MSTADGSDPIALALACLRQKQIAQARELLEQARASGPTDQVHLVEGCLGLVRWYARPVVHQVEQDLSDAITGIVLLQASGYRPLMAWHMASVGYALGTLGDLETGIAWLELAIEDARATQDDRGQIFFMAHKGSLLAYAQRLQAADEVFRQALALCVGPQAPLKAGLLNNLAYADLLRAQSEPLTEKELRTLAADSIACSEQALALMAGSPDFANYECSALDNIGQAHLILGSLDDAQAAFNEGLCKASRNINAQFNLHLGLAEVMIRMDRLGEASSQLDAATAASAPPSVGPMADRLWRTRLELARSGGRTEEIERLWNERLQAAQQRHDLLLRRVHTHAQRLVELTRLQGQARADRLALRASELEVSEARHQIEASRHTERETLMLNLHDGLGSQLATARLRAQAGDLTQSQVAALLDECIADLHLVVDTLQNEDGDLGRALRLLRNRTNTRVPQSQTLLHWDIRVDDAPHLSPVTVTTLLRIVQEAITNALKHAGATRITTSAAYELPSQTLQIEIVDDGIGLSAPNLPRGGLHDANEHQHGDRPPGNGLEYLRRRAFRLGGHLEILDAKPGVRLRFTLSLKAAPESLLTQATER